MSDLRIRRLGADLASPVPELRTIKGLGPERVRALSAAGIHSTIDLALLMPRGYIDHSEVRTISSLYASGGTGIVCNRVRVVSVEQFFARGKRTPKIRIDDGTGTALLLCFGRPFLGRQLLPDTEWLLYGSFQLNYGELQTSSFEFAPLSRSQEFYRLQPRYPGIDGIPAVHLNRFCHEAARLVSASVVDTPEGRASDLRQKFHLPDTAGAIRAIHAPDTLEQAESGRRSLAAGELVSLMAGQRQEISAGTPASDPPAADHPHASHYNPAGMAARLLETLPFELTPDQLQAMGEIQQDFRNGSLNRLIQGDVGSGKTLVALAAALEAMEKGPVAFMVPTAILANQHADSISALLKSADLSEKCPVYLLTSERSTADQAEIRQHMTRGKPALYIGTHSLFSSKSDFATLSLIIIDEQHRFGVEQRTRLREKAPEAGVIMLSATPIPRTITLTVFGGMEVSSIRTMPLGRKPVITHLAVFGREEKVYNAVARHMADGGKCYFVYPRIEADDEGGGLKSAEDMFSQLSRRYAPMQGVLVHGRMSQEEREEAMRSFTDGPCSFLVATTVIEVGVNVPEANAIVIEHAERFGLAALHQLRGRVGRGSLQSYCYLVYDTRITEDGKKRLKIMKESNDGFEIAEEDLRIRGPGNITGIEQSGYLDLDFASLYRDIDLIEAAAGRT